MFGVRQCHNYKLGIIQLQQDNTFHDEPPGNTLPDG
jgi:hypothetical protein